MAAALDHEDLDGAHVRPRSARHRRHQLGPRQPRELGEATSTGPELALEPHRLGDGGGGDLDTERASAAPSRLRGCTRWCAGGPRDGDLLADDGRCGDLAAAVTGSPGSNRWRSLASPGPARSSRSGWRWGRATTRRTVAPRVNSSGIARLPPRSRGGL